MSTRGDAAVTRQAILAAARELFAARGVDGVSVRQIAAAAGVNHALVHRYFGAKRDMVGAILASEAEAMSSLNRADADEVEALETLRGILEHVLTSRRTTLLLMLRAEIDGLAPETLVDGAAARPLGLLGDWLAAYGTGAAGADPGALAMVLGAAIFGLAALQPLLTVGAGLQDEGADEVRGRCIGAIVDIAAAAVQGGPRPDVRGALHPDQTGGPES
jgi:TetR/AcrR family transcriptional regulator, repressor for neighboring sulfatase